MSLLPEVGNPEPTSFADVLAAVVHADGVSHAQIAALADVGLSTAYRWTAGDQGQPSAGQIRRLMRALPMPSRVRIATWLLDGSGLSVAPEASEPRDTNGDGRIDAADVLEAGIEATGRAQDALQAARIATRDGRIDADELHGIASAVTEAARSLSAVEATARHAANAMQPAGRTFAAFRPHGMT